MSTLSHSSGPDSSAVFRPAFRALADEALVLVRALLQPDKIIEEVERMRALQVEADRVEAADPVRAAMLRRRASLIGLR
ncbi:MAG: hypothetical protein WKG52_01170 [Variovorax sp.]